ncbi:MAG TPA: alginate export family protein, partial [Bacillota bacterium]|nr:alginate export family protein [Bacillota bacterium]
KDQHTTIDAIGIIQDAKENGWLPVINFQDRYESEQNEKGAILNVVNSTFPAVNLNPYFIYKHDNKLNAYSRSNPAPPGGDNGDIYTLGGRVFGTPFEHWKYSLEGAYQFGEKQDTAIKFPAVSREFRDINAYGAVGKVTYMLKDKLNNQVSFAAEVLSGDDPNTSNDEMFDNLWGRYPRWSEIGLYSFAGETRIGQEANLVRFGPGWSMSPIKNMDLIVNYNALFAIEEVPTREASSTLFSHDSNFRGHFFQAVLKYKFSQHLSGHLWSEFMLPGGYYADHDLWTFLRAEVLLTF